MTPYYQCALRTRMRTLIGAQKPGCEHPGFGSNELHYATFSVPEPKGATVYVCHAYGCKMRTKFTFTSSVV